MILKEQIAEWFRSLQDEICSGLEELDGIGTFQEDIWYRDGGGGGRTRAISGSVIQKGAVNFSAIHGELPESVSKSLGLDNSGFFSTSISIVLHPKNPHVPIFLMDLQYFETDSGRQWFGGSVELVPHYIVPSDAKMFYETLKKLCDEYSDQAFEQYNQWADDYFYLKHRGESRGIGGIFFDRLEALDQDAKMSNWSFVKSVGRCFLPVYFKLILNNNHKPYGERELNWQRIRRAKFTEFELLINKRIRVDLILNCRTETVLMSMPPECRWVYDFVPDPHSQEMFTQNHLVKSMDWLNYKEA